MPLSFFRTMLLILISGRSLSGSAVYLNVFEALFPAASSAVALIRTSSLEPLNGLPLNMIMESPETFVISSSPLLQLYAPIPVRVLISVHTPSTDFSSLTDASVELSDAVPSIVILPLTFVAVPDWPTSIVAGNLKLISGFSESFSISSIRILAEFPARSQSVAEMFPDSSLDFGILILNDFISPSPNSFFGLRLFSNAVPNPPALAGSSCVE